MEYVVVHELVHFNFPNHSKEFWASVKNILPDYKKRKSNLNNHIFKYN
ncbi:M48 family metallopeptidase [Metamycoplasma hyosynoviae]